MTTLHVYFALRNQQAFQRLLDVSRPSQSSGAPPSSSGSKSWTKRNPLTSRNSTATCDVNARDQLGRTVLHLAVSSTDLAALEYVRLLLAHPRIDINVTDKESKWTPLHRAIYYGNIPAVVLLLQRTDIDTTIKDLEGYTAFDVYNSTVEGTKPCEQEVNELFTWGTNRNAALGVGDGDDRSYPEQVPIPPQKDTTDPSKHSIYSRFLPIRVDQVVMAKLHTAVVTTESKSNIRICGFGNGGRLGGGNAQHTQYSFTTLKDLPSDVHFVAVALGQDHTLALSTSGAIYSWGLARFGQLGYVLEGGATIQTTPRRVVGPLKREIVKGVAACRTASACWTDAEVLTWGTNNGQLGYDRSLSPIQILPRRVTQISQPVIDVALSDSAMAVLVQSRDVFCFYDGRNFKINFPTQSFPSEIQTYRPPMAQNNASIAKVVNCDNTFASLSSNGEVFTFTVNPPPVPSEEIEAPKKNLNSPPLKVQRIWTLRKQFSAARDIALGSDGTIIICTESGHVYTRGRTNKTSKFMRVPFLQRVVGVSASSAGAFAALRADCTPTPIQIMGRSISQDFEQIQPFLGADIQNEADFGVDASNAESIQITQPPQVDDPNIEDEDTIEDLAIQNDIKIVKDLLNLLYRDRESRKVDGKGSYEDLDLKHGADLLVQVDSGFAFPVHSTVFSFRSAILKDVITGKRVKDEKLQIFLERTSDKLASLKFTGIHPLSALLLSVYLYSDSVPALWDRRVLSPVAHLLMAYTPKTNAEIIRKELKQLAIYLSLPALAEVLDVPVKRTPSSTLSNSLKVLFDDAQNNSHDGYPTLPNCSLYPLVADTTLDLADKRVFCHSVVLRARSPFFAAFFNDPDWTCNRWTPGHTISIKLKHMRWQVVEFVMKFIYCDSESELFHVLEFSRNSDDVVDFVFSVMDVASELLLDRLILICSHVILKFININNACSILSDATFYNASQLIESIQGYISRNMESLLERNAFDNLPIHLLRQLSNFVRDCQSKKLPVTRSGTFVENAMRRWKDWLSEQDVPQLIVPRRRTTSGHTRDSPRLSPLITAMDAKSTGRRSALIDESVTPNRSPSIRARTSGAPSSSSEQGKTIVDAVFEMDDLDEEIPPMKLSEVQVTPQLVTPQANFDAPSNSTLASPWKSPSRSTPNKLDLRAIMAEAEGQRFPSSSGSTGRSVSGPDPFVIGSSTSFQKYAKQEQKRSKSDSPWRPLQAERPTSSAGLPGPKPKVQEAQGYHSSGEDAVREGSTSSSGTPRAKLDIPVTQGSPSSSGKGKAPLGPTFAPVRQSLSVSASPMMRRVSDGQSKAWNSPKLTATEATSSFSTSTTPPSFLAIQQQQLNAYSSSTRSKPKSLREIQEEEQARAEEARAVQEEAEFLLWWSQEEERIRRETMAPPVPPATGPGKKGKKKPSGDRKKSKGSQENKNSGERAIKEQNRKGETTKKPRANNGPRKDKAQTSDARTMDRSGSHS